jgi:hypothetical protein
VSECSVEVYRTVTNTKVSNNKNLREILSYVPPEFDIGLSPMRKTDQSKAGQSKRIDLSLLLINMIYYNYWQNNRTVIIHLLTYSMVQNIISKDDCHSAYQKIYFFPEVSSPCSQNPTIRPYHEPAESSSSHRSLSA